MSNTSYELIPYEDTVFACTHPDHLTVMAKLFGQSPQPVENCRVLELGCGTGTNLLSMALGLPGSRFVGIDLSPKQIQMANDAVKFTGAENTEFHALSILDVDESFGQFDYIITHGVYSWVPQAVRQKILEISKKNLAPTGVAYISYNTYPGWHIRGLTRAIMKYHARKFCKPTERLEQGRAILQLIKKAVGGPDTVYGGLLEAEFSQVTEGSDEYVFHEFLEEENNPVYFKEFVDEAAQRGLQFLTEADPVPLPQNVSVETTAELQAIAEDSIDVEQYLDFVRNRSFRRSLLCHEGCVVKRSLDSSQTSNLLFSTNTRPALNPDKNLPPGVEQFQTVGGATASTNNPMVKGFLNSLFDVHPLLLGYADLWKTVQSQIEGTEEGQSQIETGSEDLFQKLLVQCFLSKMIEFHCSSPSLTVKPGQRPLASPLARYLAGRNQQIANLRRERVYIEDVSRRVLLCLDGKTDRTELREKLGLTDRAFENALKELSSKALLMPDS